MPEIVRKYREKGRIFVKQKFTDDGAGWLLLQQLIIAPMSLITTVLLAKILSISDYGYYKYVLSIYSIVSIFGFVGFYNISSLNIQRGEDAFFNLGFKYRKLLRWIPALISLIISSYYFIQGNNFFGFIFLITIFSHLFVDLYDFYSVATMGRGNYILNLKLTIVNYFVSFFPPILIAYLTHNLYFVFISMYLCQFIFRYLAFKYVTKRLNFKKDPQNEIGEEKLKEYQKESTNLSYNGAMTVLNTSGANAVVFNRLGAEATAIYSLAITFADFVFGIVSSTTSKLLLIFSRMSKDKVDKKEKLKLVFRFSKQYFWFGLLAVMATMVALPFVYKILFAKYLFSYQYAVVYSLSILSVAFMPAYQYLFEERKIKLLNTIQTITLLAGLGSLFFSAMYFGLWGAIIVAVVMRFANYVIASMLVILKKKH